MARLISETATEATEKRRKAKAIGDKKEIRRLRSKLQREARKDKEKYWAEQCKKLEEDHKRSYKRVFQLSKESQKPIYGKKGCGQRM